MNAPHPSRFGGIDRRDFLRLLGAGTLGLGLGYRGFAATAKRT